jgi:hypothetical protein
MYRSMDWPFNFIKNSNFLICIHEYGQVVRHVASIFCQALPPSRLPMNPSTLAPDLYIFIWILASLSS